MEGLERCFQIEDTSGKPHVPVAPFGASASLRSTDIRMQEHLLICSCVDEEASLTKRRSPTVPG